MTLIDEFKRECLALKVARRINSLGVIEILADAMLARGVPEHVRCDNGPEMVAGSAGVAGAAWYEDPVHRAGQPVGERLLRELQRQAQGRVPEAGDLLQPQGGSGDHRHLAGSLQPRAAALIPGLPATRARHNGGDRTAATHIHNHAVGSQIAWSKTPFRSALQSHVAGLSTTRRGTLMALGMDGMNLGVAALSSLAAFANAHDAIWVVMQGAGLLSLSTAALRPIDATGQETTQAKAEV